MAQRSLAEESGLFRPDSIIWRVDRETAVGLAGTCALLMQIAHPLVAAGVRDHSSFEVDMAGRLRRTLSLTLAMVFGSREAAAQAARVINARHRTVNGAGYSATDPKLLLWVQATLIYSALHAYAAFIRPLSEQERDQYFQETKEIGVLLGIPWESYPERVSELDAYLEAMIERGEVSVGEDARRMARLLLYPRLPGVPGIAFLPLRIITAGLLPTSLRESYGLNWGRGQRAAYTVCRIGLHGLVLIAPSAIRFLPPARQAYRRPQPQPA